MRILLLREAWMAITAAITVVFVPIAYLWRSLPPDALRASLWRLDGTAFAIAGAGLVVAYLLLTAPAVRILLASARLSYWRQFPIPPAQWGRLHAEHLLLVNLPGTAAAAYVLAPLADPSHVVGATAGVMLVCVAGQWAVGTVHVPSNGWIRWPRPRRPATAMLRLYIAAVFQRDRPAVSLVIGAQLALVVFVALGVRNVFGDEAVTSLLDGAALVGGLLAGWLVLRGQRAVDRDRWYLDALGGANRSTELVARLGVGAAFGLPTALGLLVAAGPAGPVTATRAVFGAAVGLGWGAAVFVRIGAHAEARRRLADAPSRAIALVAIYGTVLFMVAGIAAFLVAAAAELLAARRFIGDAAAVRVRFETTAKADDHG